MCGKHHGNEQACLADKKGKCEYGSDGKCRGKSSKNNHNNEDTPYQTHLKSYLKYKTKYLNLKNTFNDQKGGNINSGIVQSSRTLRGSLLENFEELSAGNPVNSDPATNPPVVEDKSADISNFKNDDAKKYYSTLVYVMGKPPDMIYNEANGMVLYRNPTDFILGHTLLDEAVEHSEPTPHIDFLYTTIHHYIPPDLVPIVQSVSGSVMVDLLKNTITARCGTLEANYATLKTVLEIIQKKSTDIEQTTAEYIKNITNADIESDDNLKFIETEYNINKEKYKEEMKLNCHPYAFANCGK